MVPQKKRYCLLSKIMGYFLTNASMKGLEIYNGKKFCVNLSAESKYNYLTKQQKYRNSHFANKQWRVPV
jgi:hypothetical protein